MQVQIVNITNTLANNSNYKTVEMACEGKSVLVMIVSGKINYINVLVNNASHRAHKGLGKCFETFEQASESYKAPEIRAMINAAKKFQA